MVFSLFISYLSYNSEPLKVIFSDNKISPLASFLINPIKLTLITLLLSDIYHCIGLLLLPLEGSLSRITMTKLFL